METQTPPATPRRLGFWSRLWMALWIPWKVLFDAVFAQEVQDLRAAGEPEPLTVDLPAAPSTPALKAPDPTSALQLLSILQREGRFVDFLQEDVASYSDAEVGAAARLVHEGCRKALAQYVVLEPVRAESEGAAVLLGEDFDPARIRLTGNVVGRPPFRGRLAHHGWQAAEVRLPTPAEGQDSSVVAPAEVEI